jgi:nucleoside-diphosphate-sugar epimerase
MQTSVNALAAHIRDVTEAANQVEHGEAMIGDIKYSVSNNAKLLKQDWKPSVNLNEGIGRTWQWFAHGNDPNQWQ